mmetsp:Transcript_9702/g.23885  ORF Transcript_9702/g.23885 Transcript_9702/m.23885 type:complete len:377 (+) Transcript_9702:272-1402(+)
MTIATAANRATQQLALSWKSLQRIVDAVYQVPDGINGPTNSHSTRRLFGQPQPKVVLFRDNHAWCPYCQKVWLFLEEKRVPYEVRKVTMFCYGQKEAWYKKLVPSGMLPALGFFEEGQTPTSAEPGKEGPSRAVTRFVTESDDILVELEKAFGPLNGISFGDPRVTQGRKLERRLFSAWCEWLCSPYCPDAEGKQGFQQAGRELEKLIAKNGGPLVLGGDTLTVADCVLAPFLERMCASLYYYKGFQLRKEHPVLDSHGGKRGVPRNQIGFPHARPRSAAAAGRVPVWQRRVGGKDSLSERRSELGGGCTSGSRGERICVRGTEGCAIGNRLPGGAPLEKRAGRKSVRPGGGFRCGAAVRAHRIAARASGSRGGGR